VAGARKRDFSWYRHGQFIQVPAAAVTTSNQSDEANGPLAVQLQSVCHDTLPWLISFSLDPCGSFFSHRLRRL
jgi:hypothetical protein